MEVRGGATEGQGSGTEVRGGTGSSGLQNSRGIHSMPLREVLSMSLKSILLEEENAGMLARILEERVDVNTVSGKNK